MEMTFSTAEAYDQPLGNWDTSEVTGVNWIFNGATAFDQPGLSRWDVSKMSSGEFHSMFTASALGGNECSKRTVYDGWEPQGTFNANAKFQLGHRRVLPPSPVSPSASPSASPSVSPTPSPAPRRCRCRRRSRPSRHRRRHRSPSPPEPSPPPPSGPPAAAAAADAVAEAARTVAAAAIGLALAAGAVAAAAVGLAARCRRRRRRRRRRPSPPEPSPYLDFAVGALRVLVRKRVAVQGAVRLPGRRLHVGLRRHRRRAVLQGRHLPHWAEIEAAYNSYAAADVLGCGGYQFDYPESTRAHFDSVDLLSKLRAQPSSRRRRRRRLALAARAVAAAAVGLAHAARAVAARAVAAAADATQARYDVKQPVLRDSRSASAARAVHPAEQAEGNVRSLSARAAVCRRCRPSI